MNKVQAGRFKNKRISIEKEWLRIHLGWKDYLLLTPEIISRIQVIDANSSLNVLSGFWRGFFSRFIPSQTLWLSSVLSAKRNTTYTAKITYRDGTASILIINAQSLAVLVSKNTLIS